MPIYIGFVKGLDSDPLAAQHLVQRHQQIRLTCVVRSHKGANLAHIHIKRSDRPEILNMDVRNPNHALRRLDLTWMLSTQVCGEQRPEEWSVVRNLDVEQLVNDHFTSECLWLSK